MASYILPKDIDVDRTMKILMKDVAHNAGKKTTIKLSKYKAIQYHSRQKNIKIVDGLVYRKPQLKVEKIGKKYSLHF